MTGGPWDCSLQPVGQEGIGDAQQLPGCPGSPGGTALVGAQPPQRLTIRAERLHDPPFGVRLEEPGGGEGRVSGDAAEEVPGRRWTRADEV
jgi:hypothetical protein